MKGMKFVILMLIAFVIRATYQKNESNFFKTRKELAKEMILWHNQHAKCGCEKWSNAKLGYQEKSEQISFYSEGQGYWRASSYWQARVRRPPLEPTFKRLSERCTVKQEDEEIQQKWEIAEMKIKDIPIPKRYENLKAHLCIKVVHKNPFVYSGHEIKRLKDQLKKKKNKKWKEKLIELEELESDDRLFAKFFARKTISDAVIVSFFKMRGVLESISPNVKFLMNSTSDNESIFMFIIQNIEDPPSCMCKESYQFDEEFERMQTCIENEIKWLVADYDDISYRLEYYDDFTENIYLLNTGKEIPEDKWMLLYDIYNEIPTDGVTMIFGIMKSRAVDHIIFSGERNEVEYCAEIFDILLKLVCEEEPCCIFCYKEVANVYLHPFILGNKKINTRAVYDEIAAHHRKNQDHRMCSYCFKEWFKKNEGCPFCRIHLRKKNI